MRKNGGVFLFEEDFPFLKWLVHLWVFSCRCNGLNDFPRNYSKILVWSILAHVTTLEIAPLTFHFHGYRSTVSLTLSQSYRINRFYINIDILQLNPQFKRNEKNESFHVYLPHFLCHRVCAPFFKIPTAFIWLELF